MNCKFCQEKLNPLLLKQMIPNENDFVYDIECLNPECRRHNYVSQEFYIHLRKDSLKDYNYPINNKLPKDMNVIIVSMERCGISWVVRELSKYHEKMFGSDIPFIPKVNTEISHQLAGKNRFPLPKKWNNVYEIDPQVLLDRVDPSGKQYDRVLVIQRDLKTLLKVYEIYMCKDGLAPNFIKKILKKSEQIYSQIYRDDIEDSRYLKIDLWDLNSKTDVYMNKLMDFFNFPTHNRPPVVTTKTLPFERIWEAWSSVLDENYQISGRMKQIEGMFRLSKDGILDYFIENIKNPHLRRSENILEHIVVMGPNIHKGAHFSENIYYALKEKGYKVTFLPVEDLGLYTAEGLEYKNGTRVYPLSKALEKVDGTPDLIVMDEPAYYFSNDLIIPVFYVQREYKRPPKCYYPTYAFFWDENVKNYFQAQFAAHWYAQIPASHVRIIGIGVDPKRFDLTQEKKLKGIIALAGRETLDQCLQIKELTATGGIYYLIEVTKQVKEIGIPYIADDYGGLTDERFRELLPQCEGFWIDLPSGQYISRRIIEAMLCKTVCFINIENKDHREGLKAQGFNPGEHYVEFHSIKELDKLNKKFKYENYKEMVEKAYNVIMERHTFDKKADLLIDYYNEWSLRVKEIIIE